VSGLRFSHRSQLIVLVIAFSAAVAWSAARPVHFEDYLLEIATPLAGFVVLAATYRRFRFTMLSYWLVFAEAIVLIVGAHYTHERVPLFDWIRDALGWERNHYDRFAHFAVGFLLVVPIREVLRRRSPLRRAWLAFSAVMCVFALASLYEISEWWIAALASPEAGAAYLGSQGDAWDAQKDMLLDGLGGIAGIALLSRAHDRQLERFLREPASPAAGKESASRPGP
jgi:putative membrane protein